MASETESLSNLGPNQNHHCVPVAEPRAWATAMNNLGIAPMGLPGQQLVSEPLCIPSYEPSLGILTPISPMMAGISLVAPPTVPAEMPVVKEIVHCKSCTLFPQNPSLPPPSTRDRPPGCKTVFVGGLPESASEEMIREVFDRCGEIIAVRMSKKNFCHVRFAEEFMVDKAIYFSGYRMRIGSSTEKKDSGRIHVDFAQARDDLYEWECRQRLLAREERHLRHVQEDQLRRASTPPITHYTEHEAGLLAERLKEDTKFSEATALLLTWLDRGEVNRRSANHFYSMVQSVNSHVRRLMNEKAQHEEELELAKEHFKNDLLAILVQFEQIMAVLTAATRQKAWDHFSKAQRKNIEIWRKQCEELRNAHSEEIMGIRREEEMEMSDDDSSGNTCKKTRQDESDLAAQTCALKEENDSLRWQLDAYRNEVELLRQEQNRVQRVEEEHGLANFMHNSTHNVQQQLQSLQGELRRKELELEQARDDQRYVEGELLTLREKLLHSVDVTETTPGSEKIVNGSSAAFYPVQEGNGDSDHRVLLRSEKEALLLGIISTFLHVHPFGANIEYLWSYIQRLDTKVSASELERLMVRLPRMFKQELTGVGATLEKRWKFCGFEGIQSI